MWRIKNRKLSYPNGMIRSEVFIAPALDVPDTFDGGDPIVGDEYLRDGLWSPEPLDELLGRGSALHSGDYS